MAQADTKKVKVSSIPSPIPISENKQKQNGDQGGGTSKNVVEFVLSFLTGGKGGELLLLAWDRREVSPEAVPGGPWFR